MPRIFISYSRCDKSIAEYIASQLRNRGADVFIDYQQLVGGDNFIARLGSEIEQCDYLVILLSPRSVDSRWVQAEVAWAFTNRKPIVPVLLETCSMLNLFVLTLLEQIDFTRWSLDGYVDDAVFKLVVALNLPTQPLHAESVPVLTTQSVVEEQTNDLEVPVIFPREDLSELFLQAAEVAEDDPEQAMFLYNQIIRIDPSYMQGQVQSFVEREDTQLRPIRLSRMLQRAQVAVRQGHWQQAKQIGHDMLTLDKDNIDAQQLIQTCETNISGEPLYQQIVTAMHRKRIKAAETLLDDLRRTFPTYGDPVHVIPVVWPVELPMLEWCDIPTGQVVIGAAAYAVPAFRISKYPVTNAQYDVFINHRVGYSDPCWWNYAAEAQEWRSINSIPYPGRFEGALRPRETVTWYDAVAFCRWLSYVTGLKVMLPTEHQWQWAAQGYSLAEFPWNGPFDPNKSNTLESVMQETTDVDRYPNGVSSFGVMDMSGNVWEWCLNRDESLENTVLADIEKHSVRGGSFRAYGYVTCTYRSAYPSVYRDADVGFRLVCEESSS